MSKITDNVHFISSKDQKTEEFEKVSVRVSSVSIAVNVLLSVFKVIAGVVSNSGAMVSDGVHSASDVLSSIIVVAGVKISARQSDSTHPYGHERFECVAAIVLSAVLCFTGLFMGYAAIRDIAAGNIDEIAMPGMLALFAAVLSIAVKEAMYRYTEGYACRFDSAALRADAWHHRSDAFSSIGALAGIAGARMGYPAADKAASVVICIFILKSAYDIFKDAINKMVDSSCGEKTENEIKKCAEAQDGVISVDMIHTRIFGNRIYVDIEISADGKMTLKEGHDIAEKVHDSIEKNFKDVKHVMVHVNPV